MGWLILFGCISLYLAIGFMITRKAVKLEPPEGNDWGWTWVAFLAWPIVGLFILVIWWGDRPRKYEKHRVAKKLFGSRHT